MNRNFKKTSLTLDADMYEDFKKIAKENDTDASKLIRKFVRDYVKKNRDKWQKTKM
jgi:metal-responsive CopG/Arc/MetJ family transcriptional regulator